MLACTRLALHKGKEMEHSDIEHMAQGFPPSHIGKDHEEVVTELAKHALELQQKLDAVAAEMSVVEAIHDECVFVTDEDYEACPKNVKKIIRSLAVMQIPDTEAYRNSVRAEGVEMSAARIREAIRSFKEIHHGAVNECADIAADVASKLRAETDTTPSQYESLVGGK